MNNTKIWDESLWEPNEFLWNTLFKHRNHKIVISTYGDWDDPDDMCLECETCNQVIIDTELYTLAPRSDIDE